MATAPASTVMSVINVRT